MVLGPSVGPSFLQPTAGYYLQPRFYEAANGFGSRRQIRLKPPQFIDFPHLPLRNDELDAPAQRLGHPATAAADIACVNFALGNDMSSIAQRRCWLRASVIRPHRAAIPCTPSGRRSMRKCSTPFASSASR